MIHIHRSGAPGCAQKQASRRSHSIQAFALFSRRTLLILRLASFIFRLFCDCLVAGHPESEKPKDSKMEEDSGPKPDPQGQAGSDTIGIF